ncbi:hypothetical protein [Paraburkholderia agricolaris]|uniref:hypothetical protein n=1 Tax=Paraburkholderia agricolaris TaxID=2152888 RepID=UPI0012909061|nr:hypothetical protein [Paraburkholderia agricolaris]
MSKGPVRELSDYEILASADAFGEALKSSILGSSGDWESLVVGNANSVFEHERRALLAASETMIERFLNDTKYVREWLAKPEVKRAIAELEKLGLMEEEDSRFVSLAVKLVTLSRNGDVESRQAFRQIWNDERCDANMALMLCALAKNKPSGLVHQDDAEDFRKWAKDNSITVSNFPELKAQVLADEHIAWIADKYRPETLRRWYDEARPRMLRPGRPPKKK